jgi:hypothetical protein
MVRVVKNLSAAANVESTPDDPAADPPAEISDLDENEDG